MVLPWLGFRVQGLGVEGVGSGFRVHKAFIAHLSLRAPFPCPVRTAMIQRDLAPKMRGPQHGPGW